MIRKTLPSAQAATFSILMPDKAAHDFPRPTGTGFFVSPDGFFVTARHVVTDHSTGTARDDLDKSVLMKEMRINRPDLSGMCQWPELVFEDVATDIAVLSVDFKRNADKDWLAGRSEFPFLPVSTRLLEEGEPVYAFGYPLPESNVQVIAGGGVITGDFALRPRVTSAIVSSTLWLSGPIQSSADPVNYVLDKALNYGNSGGPIIASETGHAHAICTRFDPVKIPQPLDAAGNRSTVWIPSLYGVVSSLSNRAVRNFLADQGVPLSDT